MTSVPNCPDDVTRRAANFESVPAFALRKVLLPINFSAQSAGAVAYSKSLAEQFGAALTLLHVIPPLHEVAPDAHFPELSNDAVRQRMHEILGREPLGHVRIVILTGDPAYKIINFAKADHSDVIVMPTHGYGRLRRFFMGSVVCNVMQGAHCPVWTGLDLRNAVPLGSSGFQQILCATDLGPSSERTVKFAAALANRSHATLRLMHVLARLDRPEKVSTETRERMIALASHCGIHADIELISDDAPGALSSALVHSGADLLVIGRHPQQDSHRHGTADVLVHHAHCPVVSVL